MKWKLKCGDNIEVMRKMPDNSIDSIVTDPPYALTPKKGAKGGFMGKLWDADVPSVEFWREVYRVLKPGGHILSFGGTRTYHRMVVNIEDAGFEIRDQIMWLYGSGFPKSHNIGKAVDKIEGNEREIVGTKKQHNIKGDKLNYSTIYDKPEYEELKLTKGTSQYEGWGTALKPANEPICMARKPLSEKSVAENVMKWGTGGINVDGCRVSHNEPIRSMKAQDGGNKVYQQAGRREETTELKEEGRFPANLILECCCDEVIKGEKGEVKKETFENYGNGEYGKKDGRKTQPTAKEIEGIRNYNDKGDTHTNPMCPCRLMDEQSGTLSNQSNSKRKGGFKTEYIGGENINKYETMAYSDKGGASRFFYQAKVSKKERNLGLDEFEEKKKWLKGGGGGPGISDRESVVSKNNHPTLKPINLMTYLCRLITPTGGVILDPFMGSGSTGISALLEGFDFVGIDMTEDYVNIAEARIKNYEQYRELLKK